MNKSRGAGQQVKKIPHDKFPHEKLVLSGMLGENLFLPTR